MPPPLSLLYQDEYFCAIDKAAGDFVHPPEISPYPVPREKICVFKLNEQLRRSTYPVHRLDAPTSGVLLFAFSKDSTRRLSQLFMRREMSKTYHAVARGFTLEDGKIEIPLEISGFRNPMESTTLYRSLAKIELPFAVGKKYPTARYSLIEAIPTTGRWHQIRRHFDRIAHPLLGDIEHGDSHHNRFFRDQLRIPGLCLRAKTLSFVHPWTLRPTTIEAPPSEKWTLIYQLFSDHLFSRLALIDVLRPAGAGGSSSRGQSTFS